MVPRYQEVSQLCLRFRISFLSGVIFRYDGHGVALLALGIWPNNGAQALKMAPF